MATYKSLFRKIETQLIPRYDSGEAAAIARLFLEATTGLTPTQAMTRTAEIPPLTVGLIERGMAELAGGKPVQYVLGRAHFGGRSFLIDKRALIPRPETEELVHWVITDCKERGTFSLLDVGTGSGCIALSLAAALPNASVTALDFSAEALALARENSLHLKIPAHFVQASFLEETSWKDLPTVDVVVSNPPYIPEEEGATLESHVREWEPAAALFVPSADPLVFYRALSRFGMKKMTAGGALYCETHRDYAEAVKDLFLSKGWQSAEVQNDLFGAPRMVRAMR